MTPGDVIVGEEGSGVTVQGGVAATGGAGAPITLTAGTATGAAVGGSVVMEAGSSGSGDPGDIVLTPGIRGGVVGQVILSRSGIQIPSRSSVPGPAMEAGQGRLWVRNDSVSSLVFTDDSGYSTSLGLHAPERGVYSILEYGASMDPLNDSSQAFQDACDACEAAGGGVVEVPPVNDVLTQGYRIITTVTIPANVTLAGRGPRSRIVSRMAATETLFQFNAGYNEGGIQDLAIYGDSVTPLGWAINFTGSTKNLVRRVEIWDHEIGFVFSDGITQFAAYNVVRDFSTNRCATGVRAYEFANQNSISHGRIFWSIDGADGGIAIDVDDAVVLKIEDVAVESYDLGLRVRGIVDLSIIDCYFESGDAAREWLDVAPDKTSTITFRGHDSGNLNSTQFQAGPEEVIDWNGITAVYFGAKRHHAASADRNLVENGDFQIGDYTAGVVVAIPQWALVGTPTLAISADVWSQNSNRAIDITRASGANDGLAVACTVPERCEYVTACIAYKNIDSEGPYFSITSSEESANFPDPVPADAGASWRIATITLIRNPASGDDDDNGNLAVNCIADNVAAGNGGTIRVGAVWAVPGQVATGHRMHGHRIQLIDRPTRVVNRTNITSNETFGPVNLALLSDPYQQAPRGAIGIMGRIRVIIDDGGSVGTAQANPVMVYVTIPNGPGDGSVRCIAERSEQEYTADFIVRDMTLAGGLTVLTGVMPNNIDYSIDLVAWILP